jgi:hypothetical protein
VWKEGNPVQLAGNLSLPGGFKLGAFGCRCCNVKTTTGKNTKSNFQIMPGSTMHQGIYGSIGIGTLCKTKHDLNFLLSRKLGENVDICQISAVPFTVRI